MTETTQKNIRPLLPVFSKKKFLIAGGNGLIGSAVIRLLAELNNKFDAGIQIFAVSRSKAVPNAGTIFGDICSLDVGERFDYILHAASPACRKAYVNTPVDVMKANTMGTIRLLEAAQASGGRLLFISSSEVYADADADFAEDSPLLSLDACSVRHSYPAGKLAGELLCTAFHVQYGTDTLIARPGYAYGPGGSPASDAVALTLLREAVRDGSVTLSSAGGSVRSWCYAEDAASALLYILAFGESGQIYNVADRRSVASIREFAGELSRIAGVPLRVPATDDGAGSAARRVLDSSRLEALGWRPQYDLHGGLAESLAIERTYLERHDK